MAAAENLLRELMARDSDECALWPLSRTPRGYGQLWFENRRRDAHVVACVLAHGPKPTTAHCAAHGCGVRRCVNPRHLRWATPKENTADMLLHGTKIRGEAHPLHKFTEAGVLAVRSAFAAGESQAALARRFGITPQAIHEIVRRKSWAHLDEEA